MPTNLAEIFRRRGVNLLYYFAPLSNVASILKHGILSRKEVKGLGIPHEDFSLRSAQDRRESINVAGRPLHSYVPLLMNPRCPMFEERLRELAKKLACLAVSLKVCVTEGLRFSDGNLAYDGSQVFSSVEEAQRLPWDKIMGTRGNNRIRGAEVLIPDKVELTHILDVLVMDPNDPDTKKLLPQSPPPEIGYKSFRTAYFFQRGISLDQLVRETGEI